MSLIIITSFFLLSVYAIILIWLAFGFFQTKRFNTDEKKNQIPVSIIICARNEEKTIETCLNSIIQQNYSSQNIQLILINDASIDNTLKKSEYILQNSNIDYQIISNSKKNGKKQSISNAMQFTKNELIILRDADTFTISKIWLQTISDFHQNTKTDLIIGPINISNNVGILWAIQAIENSILNLLSCGSNYFNCSFLCSGANLIFSKSLFEKTYGYNSHLNIESGDDVLFLEDVKKIKHAKILYLKSTSAMVYTYPCYSFLSLVKQKIRWASKFKSNPNRLNFILSAITFLVNLLCLISLITIYVLPQLKFTVLVFILLKLIIDILLLFLSSSFMKNKNLNWFSLPVMILYPLYVLIIGMLSFFLKPKWK